VATDSQIPTELLLRIEEEVGPVDAALERAIGAVYRATSAEEFYDAERGMRAELMRRADLAVGAVLKHKTGDDAFVKPAKALMMERAKAAGVKMKSHGRRPTRVRLLGGTEIQLRTLQLLPVAPVRAGRKRGVGRRGKTGSGVYPALAVLGIEGRATPALRAEVAREVGEANSVSVARASLAERGLDVPHKVALRLTYLFGDRALEHRSRAIAEAEAKPPEVGELAGARVSIGIDGGRLRIRENPKAGRRNAKTRHRKYKAPWREPKVMTVYVIDDKGEKHARHRAFLDATMGDADAAVALLIGHLRLLGAHHAAHVTLNADGAAWIWARAEEIRSALGLAEDKFTEIVDHYHAMEHLTEISKMPKAWTEAERAKWIKKAKRLINAGRVEDLITHIKTLAVGRRGKTVNTACQYFENHKDRMRYAHFRVAGLPIGSGATESAVRRVVNLRLKGNSIYWLEDHAEAMLHLRSALKCGRWDELVRATLQQPAWTPRPRPKAA
jgi:hypothetical protein